MNVVDIKTEATDMALSRGYMHNFTTDMKCLRAVPRLLVQHMLHNMSRRASNHNMSGASESYVSRPCYKHILTHEPPSGRKIAVPISKVQASSDVARRIKKAMQRTRITSIINCSTSVRWCADLGLQPNQQGHGGAAGILQGPDLCTRCTPHS